MTPTPAKPNILIIYSDQHRYDCIGANGHPQVQTPNMDRLAREGANFSHAFTPIPMCVPARCSMLTGQWPSQHGVIFNFDGETFKRLDPNLPTAPGTLQQAGYHCIHVGRWHVDPQRKPLDFGFHDYVPDWRYGKWRRMQEIPSSSPENPEKGERFAYTDEHAKPEESGLAWNAGQTINWIERMQDEPDPFFIRWHCMEPHLVCKPPEPYASMYDPKSLKPWPGFGDQFENKPYIQKQMLKNWDIEGWTWDDWAPVAAKYLGVISLLDHEIGRVLDTLDRLGIAENTLVIYTSDHGDMCGSHGMVDKHYNMYDDIVRVPMIMRWPGKIPAGTQVEDFVSNAIDIPTTICAAAGAEVPDSFQGENLLIPATQKGSIKREDIFASYSGNQFGSYSVRMLRDRRYKYVWNATAQDELYELDSDPGELKNRIDDPELRDELVRLRARLAAWMEATDDTLHNRFIRRQLLENAKL